MQGSERLQKALRRIDGRGYKAYKEIRGAYAFAGFTLRIDHVQGDPYAAPSRVRVQLAAEAAGFPPDTFEHTSRRVALGDYLTRTFAAACRRRERGGGGDARGSGRSGEIAVERPGQQILERTSAFVDGGRVEARFTVGLPAFGRRVAGRKAESVFFDQIPRMVRKALVFESLDAAELYRHLRTAEDADALRAQLADRELVAFVADGAVLPRASGVDPRPLDPDQAIPFRAPESMRVELRLSDGTPVYGMGVPRGVTLIVGGGYHGKSTLLRAIELGVYNHVPADGRERVVTDPAALKIRAEDGRRIQRVDITQFIDNLPLGRDTRAFSTEDASGSTSQAANIIEGLEAGARVLLIDEDTSATNFMIRDHRMQELVAKASEPITPFIDKVRSLHRDLGVSTVLVIGGAGDYFDVADQVVCMEDYLPRDATAQAGAVAARIPTGRRTEAGGPFAPVTPRVPLADSFDPRKGKREVKISPRGLQSIHFGTHHIDLGAVEQLVDPAQTRAIGDAIHHATRHMDGARTLREVVEAVAADVAGSGLDVLAPWPHGGLAAFRPLELAAAVNRLRTLRMRQKE